MEQWRIGKDEAGGSKYQGRYSNARNWHEVMTSRTRKHIDSLTDIKRYSQLRVYRKQKFNEIKD